MAGKRRHRADSQIDVVERVLDKGIVIDAVACVSVLGIDHVLDIDARVVVASIDTYVRYAELLSGAGRAARPARIEADRTENRVAAIVSHTQGDCSTSFSFDRADSIRARGLSVRLNSRDCGDGRQD